MSVQCLTIRTLSFKEVHNFLLLTALQHLHQHRYTSFDIHTLERERERERECVCVCVCVHACAYMCYKRESS